MSLEKRLLKISSLSSEYKNTREGNSSEVNQLYLQKLSNLHKKYIGNEGPSMRNSKEK